MLTKDTLQKLSRGFIRSLSPKRAIAPSVCFRVKIPQDKLDLLVGMRLEDRYYVMSLLGKGGMSLVYKAKDLRTGQVVAVKCLRTQVLGDEMVVKRFEREADVLNRLNHPRIVSFLRIRHQQAWTAVFRDGLPGWHQSRRNSSQTRASGSRQVSRHFSSKSPPLSDMLINTMRSIAI